MSRFSRVRQLERYLGDPFDPSSALNHKVAHEWDEQEHYPAEALEVLEKFGIAADFVPVAHGGELRGYDELLSLARTLASRNLTVAVTMSAMIWSTLLWIAGDEEQQRAHAKSILAFRCPCLAYSEEEHGADLLASETVATRVEGGYRITGRKWPINRAVTGQSVVLLARTGNANDPRGLSLFWFEKDSLDPATHRPVPRVPTLGVRGTDISGIELEGAFVPEGQRIGPEGAGLEIALKGLHITRTLCAGLSVGAVECALRTTVRLAEGRRLYGDAIIALNPVRTPIVEAYAMFLALEVASLVAARMIHVSPWQVATISATTKYAIPRLSEDTLQRLASVHGARFYMREHHDWGVMQKVFRDNLLIAIFDGSTPVNLSSLAGQLGLLARAAPAALGGAATDTSRATAAFERVERAAALGSEPPPLVPSELDLLPRADDMVGSFAELHRRIVAKLEDGPTRELLLPLLAAMESAIHQLHTEIRAFDAVRRNRKSGVFMDGAERYAVLWVAVATTHGWWSERDRFRADRPEAWIVLALRQALRTIAVPLPPVESRALEAAHDSLAADVRARSASAGCFSLFS